MATQDISQLVVEVKSQGIQTGANQLDKLAVAADKAEAAVRKLGTAVITINGAMTGGMASAAALVAAMTTLTAVLQRMSQVQVQNTTNIHANNAAMREANALARGLSGSLGALWVTYGNLAGMAVGIALGASLKGIVTNGMAVEQTLEEIRIQGVTTMADMEKVAATINDLGRGINGPKEVAEALKTLTLAGLNAEQAMTGVGAALNLAVGGGVGIEKAAETLVQVGSALGYTAEGFDHVADVVMKAAAVSMSSVDSISGAFKSAAAIGTVYGASLQDIALGLAAVANLGIQGTAAGTALKNMYKDLSASTQKVTKTLKDMHMSISDFRGSDGYMLPLIDVVKKLDTGLGTMSDKARNMAMVKLFGQQGVREGAELIKLLHTASDQIDVVTGKLYGSKLDEMYGQINKAAAFSTLAAIAMAQTTTNQLKAVANTLQTTFVSVFKDVSPQIGEIARDLKSAFASPEFKAGLTAVATTIANITKFIIEDKVAVLELAAAWWGGLKLMALIPMLEAAVVAAGGLGPALIAAYNGFKMAAAGAALLDLALGPIGIALAALTAAWILYKSKQDDALNANFMSATGNLQEYTEGVIKAAQNEQKILEMRKEHKTQAEIDRQQQINADQEASDRVVNTAKARLQSMKDELDLQDKNLSAGDRTNLWLIKQGMAHDFVTANVKKYLETEKQYNTAQSVYTENVNHAAYATKRLIELRSQNDKLNDAAQRAGLKLPTGDGELTQPGAGSGADAYAAAIAKFTNDIKAANQDLENARELADSKFKAGQIGRLQLIDLVADKEVATAKRIAQDARDAAEIAAAHVGKDGKADKSADVERFKAEAERADKDAAQANKMRNSNKIAAERQMQTEIVALQVKTLTDQGKFVEAAQLKWSAEGKVLWEQAQADAANTGSETAKAYVAVQYAIRDAAMQAAQLKEDTLAFNTALLGVESTLKGFKSATYGTSIDTMFETATEATKKYEAALADAKQKELTLALAAGGISGNDGTPEAKKAYAEAHKEMLAIGDKQKTMWQEVGQTITDSLTNAFGKSGTALGELYKGVIKYQQTENANASDRMNQYGDMTNAASGFFDKQSKGYKALHAVSEAFHIAAMARTLAQTAASVVAGAAQFFSQSGWGGFAGVAAMGAVLAGLGYTMAGGSSHADPSQDAEYVQKHQGTGTVLGDADAKSESMKKAMDDLKSNSDAMLPVSQAMLNSLRNIEAAMVGVAKLAVQNGITNGSNFDVQTGQLNAKGTPTDMISKVLTRVTDGLLGPIVGGKLASIANNLWGKTKAEISDSGLQFGGKVADLQTGKGIDQYANVKTTTSSWFGLAKSSKNNMLTQGVGDEMSAQFGLIFKNLQDTMAAAAPALGTTGKAVSDAISNMVIDTKKISLKDLKGDDLTNAINNVISEAMDEVAKKAYPEMQAFQQVGEGYAQTVIRVASGVEQANAAMKKLGLTAINYTDVLDKTGDVSYNIVKQTIALKENGTGVGAILEQVSGAMSDVVSAYTDLVAAREQMQQYGLGSGLNIDTLQGAGDLKALQSGLTSYYDKFFTDQEKVVIQTKDMTDKFGELGLTLPQSRDELRSWIELAANTGDQLKVGKLLTLAGAFDTLEASIEKGGKFGDDAVKAAKTAMDDAYTQADNAYKVIEDIINKQKDTLKATQETLKTNISDLTDLLDNLSDAIKSTAPKQTDVDAYAKAMATIRNATSVVNGGGNLNGVKGLDDAFKTVTSQGTDGYKDDFEFRHDQAVAHAALVDLNKSGTEQLTAAQQELDAVQKQLDALDATLQVEKDQLDALKGIDKSITDLGQAINAFGQAVTAAQAAKNAYDATVAGSTGGTGAAVESLYKSVLGRASDAGGKAYWTDAIDNKGVTVSSAATMMANSEEKQSSTIAALYQSVLGRAVDSGGMQFYLDSMKKGASMAEIQKDLMDSDEYKSHLPSFDVGTNFVPEDMIAQIHKGERIIPAADNAALEKRLKDDEEKEAKQGNDSTMVDKMDELILALQQGDVANVQKTNEMYKLIREWHTTGMPPTRSDK